MPARRGRWPSSSSPPPPHARAALAGRGAATGVPAVAAARAAPPLSIKREALKALALLPPDHALRSKIVPYVGAREPWIRAAALPALAHTDREEFALVLSGLDPDPDWTRRAALASALGAARDEARPATLPGMLQDAHTPAPSSRPPARR